LIEASHNVAAIGGSPTKRKHSSNSKKQIDVPCESPGSFEGRLEEARISLRDEMRNFQSEILGQFEAHKTRMEVALAKESSEKQTLMEENRLLREELSRCDR
jgi:predicted DNA-binding ArsR family transcriptional regulator